MNNYCFINQSQLISFRYFLKIVIAIQIIKNQSLKLNQNLAFIYNFFPLLIICEKFHEFIF